MAGWIKVYKDLADHWLAQDLEKLGWWTILLLRVSHEDKKVLAGNTLIELKRGQIVASLNFLADLWKTSKRSAERFVELLEQDNMVSRCTSRKVTILTICNYASYQDSKRVDCANSCANDAPIGIQSVSEIKKDKEVIEINVTTTAHAHTYTCEEYAAKYRSEDNWSEVGILIHANGVDDCKALFEDFVANNKHDGKTWQEYNDFKRHFRQWATQQVQRRAKSHQQPQATPKKVITGQDIFKVYG